MSECDNNENKQNTKGSFLELITKKDYSLTDIIWCLFLYACIITIEESWLEIKIFASPMSFSIGLILTLLLIKYIDIYHKTIFKKLKNILNKNITLNDKTYYIKDTINFKNNVIKHPTTNEIITSGKIIDIKQNKYIELYLADACDGFEEGSYISSWIKTFDIKDLEKYIQNQN